MYEPLFFAKQENEVGRMKIAEKVAKRDLSKGQGTPPPRYHGVDSFTDAIILL